MSTADKKGLSPQEQETVQAGLGMPFKRAPIEDQTRREEDVAAVMAESKLPVPYHASAVYFIGGENRFIDLVIKSPTPLNTAEGIESVRRTFGQQLAIDPTRVTILHLYAL